MGAGRHERGSPFMVKWTQTVFGKEGKSEQLSKEETPLTKSFSDAKDHNNISRMGPHLKGVRKGQRKETHVLFLTFDVHICCLCPSSIHLPWLSCGSTEQLKSFWQFSLVMKPETWDSSLNTFPSRQPSGSTDSTSPNSLTHPVLSISTGTLTLTCHLSTCISLHLVSLPPLPSLQFTRVMFCTVQMSLSYLIPLGGFTFR